MVLSVANVWSKNDAFEEGQVNNPILQNFWTASIGDVHDIAEVIAKWKHSSGTILS